MFDFDALDVMEDSPELPMDRDAHIAQDNATDNPDIVITFLSRWGTVSVEGRTTLGDQLLGVKDGTRVEYRFDVPRRVAILCARASAAGLTVAEVLG